MKKMSITQLTILIYIILMPFSLFGPKKFGINVKLCDFIFPVMLVSFLAEKRYNMAELLRRNRVFLTFLVFISACLLSFFNSIDIKKSLLELGTYFYLLLLSAIVVSSIDSEEAFYSVIKAWLITTGIVLIIALIGFVSFFRDTPSWALNFVQYSNIDKTYTQLPRIKATFFTPNMLLAYLHTSAIFAVAYFFAVPKKRGRLILAIPIFVGAFLTFSRRFCGYLLSIFLIQKRFSKTKAMKLAAYAMLILFLVFLVTGLLTTVWQIFPIECFSLNTQISHHFLPHLVSFRMFLKHPLIGIGAGTYNLSFPNFYTPKDWPEKCAQDPHSMYFGILAENGIVGFSALILFFFTFYRFVRSSKKDIEAEYKKNIIYILTCGLTGFLLNGLMTDILTMRHLWFLMALTVAFISICNKKTMGGAFQNEST